MIWENTGSQICRPENILSKRLPPKSQVPSANEKDAANDRLVYVKTYFPGTLDERQAATVEVSAEGTAIANFAVQASRAYRVSGTVTGTGAQGMAQLMLLAKNGQGENQNLTEGGKFDFQNVLPGTYHAQVMMVSFGNGQNPSIKMRTIRPPIEVNGSDVVGLQLQLDAGGDVSGKFRAEGDEKINWSELNVTLLTVAEGEEEPARLPVAFTQPSEVQEDGSFEIKDAPGGNCQLAVGARSEKFRNYYTKSVLLGGREVVDTGFAVTPGTVLDVVVSAKGAGVEGTVVDREGKPASGASVVTIPGSGKLGRPDAYQYARADECRRNWRERRDSNRGLLRDRAHSQNFELAGAEGLRPSCLRGSCESNLRLHCEHAPPSSRTDPLRLATLTRNHHRTRYSAFCAAYPA
jgi:hypothetical protein